MSKAEEIANRVLEELSQREGKVIMGGSFGPEPILRTGRQLLLDQDALGGRNARIKEMRAQARAFGWNNYYYGGPKLFAQQARLMEDYEDDLPFKGSFEKYYPTYEDMSDRILRGYFSWRTRFRAGETPEAPLPFLFVHAYELLCGVGAAVGAEDLARLGRLRETYAALPGNRPLGDYLSLWMHDYVIYYNLDLGLLEGLGSNATEFSAAVTTLRRAEQALLKSDANGRWSRTLPGAPTSEELFRALARLSRYRIERSKLLALREDVLREAAASVFARMVEHCQRRRKHGFVDGLFGEPTSETYVMFSSAVFYAAETHPNQELCLPCGEVYRCQEGRWTLERPCRARETSAELGDILHALDCSLRQHVGGLPALKARAVPRYVQNIVEQEVESCLALHAAEEAVRVRIDRSRLTGIRDAALRTREALLTEDERLDEGDRGEADFPDDEAPPSSLAAGAVSPDVQGSFPLTSQQRDILGALLEGRFDRTGWGQRGTLLSLELDEINELLFDEVGDTVIEFVGEEPRLVEDYVDDVREVLS